MEYSHILWPFLYKDHATQSKENGKWKCKENEEWNDSYNAFVEYSHILCPFYTRTMLLKAKRMGSGNVKRMWSEMTVIMHLWNTVTFCGPFYTRTTLLKAKRMGSGNVKRLRSEMWREWFLGLQPISVQFHFVYFHFLLENEGSGNSLKSLSQVNVFNILLYFKMVKLENYLKIT